MFQVYLASLGLYSVFSINFSCHMSPSQGFLSGILILHFLDFQAFLETMKCTHDSITLILSCLQREHHSNNVYILNRFQQYPSNQMRSRLRLRDTDSRQPKPQKLAAPNLQARPSSRRGSGMLLVERPVDSFGGTPPEPLVQIAHPSNMQQAHVMCMLSRIEQHFCHLSL